MSSFRRQLIYMICTAMLIAVGATLKIFMTYNFILSAAITNRVGFHLLMVYIAAIYFGPFYGMTCGALIDFLSSTLAPVGIYNPLYTVTMTLVGLCVWFLYKVVFKNLTNKLTLKRIPSEIIKILLVVIITQTILVLPLNTLWQVLISGGKSLYFPLLFVRSFSLIFYFPVFTILLSLLLRVLTPIVRRMENNY